jgi:predicted enzyme related to lactoylglutathione lyase
MNLNSILIGSEDPDGLVAYYSKLFGEPTYADGGYTGWMLGSGSLSVGPHDQVKGRNQQPGRILWNLETPDVPAEFERLRGAGATVVQEPYHPGEGDQQWDGWVATLEDPDGNYFQLMSPMEAPEG